MQPRKRMLLSTTMVPLIVFAGVVVGGAILVAGPSARPALAQCAPKKKINPCAAAKPSPCAAACNPCNPCAAAKCNPCNPCAAAKCNPCNPCNPCAAAACSPCGAGKICVVPRLQAAAACNPCAAATCNPCSPCNPCAAAKCNPCNPCAAATCNPCSPCNPCAAAKCNPCNPCNPCAAAKCNPCNPCAAAKCNPCNPCGACNPCAAGGTELTDAEAVAAYDCLLNELKAAYAKSGNDIAVSYANWPRYSKQAYLSGTHGGRYVQNYANAKARAYGAYENAGQMPSGSVLAKDSFAVKPNGRVSVGPLFLMEKMNAGFNADSGNWRYTMILPNGSVFGTTGGAGGAKVQFCVECHISVAPEVDSMFFMPEEYRAK